MRILRVTLAKERDGHFVRQVSGDCARRSQHLIALMQIVGGGAATTYESDFKIAFCNLETIKVVNDILTPTSKYVEKIRNAKCTSDFKLQFLQFDFSLTNQNEPGAF